MNLKTEIIKMITEGNIPEKTEDLSFEQIESIFHLSKRVKVMSIKKITFQDVFDVLKAGTELKIRFNDYHDYMVGITAIAYKIEKDENDSNLYNISLKNVSLSGCDADTIKEFYEMYDEGDEIIFTPGIYKYLDYGVDNPNEHFVFEFDVLE